MAIALSEKRFRFVLRNLMYLRNFEGIVSGLADRGYKIYITTSPKDLKVPPELRELARAARGALSARGELRHHL